VSLLGLKPQSHVNPAYHEYIAFQFDLTYCFPHQASTRRIDLTRLQRASKGSRKSTCGGRDNIIKRRGVRFRDCGRNPVVLGNRAVDSENDRLRFRREIRFTHRSFHTLDSDLGTINYA
jgi:hypothetical protein